VRTGEALGLKFDDFDVKNRVIKIRKSLTRGVLGLPKTESSIRDVAMIRPAWELLEQRRRMNERGSPWFFYSAHPKGGIISRQALRRAWRAMLGAFDIDARPLYATRHTFASLAIAAGEDPLWVAETMGHSRPDQLFLKYASHMEGIKKDGEKVVELVMGQKQSFLRALP
jgi:integrase